MRNQGLPQVVDSELPCDPIDHQPNIFQYGRDDPLFQHYGYPNSIPDTAQELADHNEVFATHCLP